MRFMDGSLHSLEVNSRQNEAGNIRPTRTRGPSSLWSECSPAMSIADSMKRALKPIAKRVLFQTVQPTGPARRLLSGLSDAAFVSREMFEWAQRSLVATPMFLSKCAVHGDKIAIDRMPY